MGKGQAGELGLSRRRLIHDTLFAGLSLVLATWAESVFGSSFSRLPEIDPTKVLSLNDFLSYVVPRLKSGDTSVFDLEFRIGGSELYLVFRDGIRADLPKTVFDMRDRSARNASFPAVQVARDASGGGFPIHVGLLAGPLNEEVFPDPGATLTNVGILTGRLIPIDPMVYPHMGAPIAFQILQAAA